MVSLWLAELRRYPPQRCLPSLAYEGTWWRSARGARATPANRVSVEGSGRHFLSQLPSQPSRGRQRHWCLKSRAVMSTSLTSTRRCSLPSEHRYSRLVRFNGKKTVPTWNCSQQGVWIIFSYQVMISVKKLLSWMLNVIFLALWAPVSEGHLVPIYSKTLPLTPKQSRWIKSTTGERKCVFDLGWTVPLTTLDGECLRKPKPFTISKSNNRSNWKQKNKNIWNKNERIYDMCTVYIFICDMGSAKYVQFIFFFSLNA